MVIASGEFKPIPVRPYTAQRPGESAPKICDTVVLREDPSPFAAANLATTFIPRIPRYQVYDYSKDRMGLTGSYQWQITDKTLLTVDGRKMLFVNVLAASGAK